MNSKHSQFSSDNQRDLEVLGLIEELNNDTSQMISGGGLPTVALLQQQPTLTPQLLPQPQNNQLDIYNGTTSSLYFDLSFGNTVLQDILLKPGDSRDFTGQANTADARFDGDFSQAGIQLNKTTIKAPGNYAFVTDPSGSILSLV